MEYERLTYRQLGDALGISPDAARMKAKRESRKGRWRLIQGNHPNDPVHVEVPPEDLIISRGTEEERPERLKADPDAVIVKLVDLLADERQRADDLMRQLCAEKDACSQASSELAAAEARELGTAQELRTAMATIEDLKRKLKRRNRWSRRGD